MRTVLIKAKESKHTIWSETNFVEYPYFRLGKKNSSDKELRIEIQTPSGTALWLVENTKGLPGVLSYEIFTALEFLIDRNGITADGKLYFSIKDIINPFKSQEKNFLQSLRYCRDINRIFVGY